MIRVGTGSVSGSLLSTGILCSALLAAGWTLRDERYLSAGFGPGYVLGVAGLAMMTLLLLYSVRKHLRLLSGWGPLRRWFHVHMALGLLGPTAVILHCNFELGSINSTIVLLCTLFVSGSGIVGRLVYTRIHEQLTGRRRQLGELRKQLQLAREDLDARALPEAVVATLREIDRELARASDGQVAAFVRFVTIGSKVRSAARACAQGRERLGGDAREAIASYLATARGAARFAVYERIFSLWHAVHLPLCVLLFASAGIHVFAVHNY